MTPVRKAIFLEYKFGDYDTDLLKTCGATEVVAWLDGLTPSRWRQVSRLGVGRGISFAALADQSCPASPQSYDRLTDLLKWALSWHPQTIMLDHFRFGGRWEDRRYSPVHVGCRYCRSRPRNQILATLAQGVRGLVPVEVELGYYAVPFRFRTEPGLGQDHGLLSKYFDLISPMVYHRMLDRPVSYISAFSRYLARLTATPILPIVQVKDMPDRLADGLTESILRAELVAAVQPPSVGVAWFSWDGAVEKHKTDLIARLNRSI